MARLHYSTSAFGRALLMSSVAAYVFVEGDLDKAFVDRMMSNDASWQKVPVLLRLARELDPALGDGKLALLQLHTKLRQQKRLEVGGRKRFLFFLDKDIDDTLRIKRRCNHIVYTDFYNIENYIFRYSRLQRAAADAAYQQTASLVFLSDPVAWTKDASRVWASWVGFSLAVRKNKQSLPNFGHVSMFHNKTTLVFEPQKQSEFQKLLAGKLGIPIVDVERICGVEERRFLNAIRHDRHDQYWNGKWYSHILVRQLRLNGLMAKTADKAFEDRLEASALAHLDFTGDWIRPLSMRLLSAVKG